MDAVLERFVGCLRRSCLLPPTVINRVLKEFASTYTADGQTTAAFTELLISREYLTEWHCKNLSEGRFKGFYFPDKYSPTSSTEQRYLIMKHLQTDATVSKYVALELETGRAVVLAIRPPDPNTHLMSYAVE